MRAIDAMTMFDIHEIYVGVKDLPHYEAKDHLGREGFFFDLDMWPTARVNALWTNIQERRKRINDVWGSEMRRNDYLGTLSVEFGARHVKAPEPERRPRKPFYSSEYTELVIPAMIKGARQPTLASMLKKREQQRNRRTIKKDKAQAKKQEDDGDDEEEEEEEVEPEKKLVPSDDDDEDWGANDPRFQEEDSDDSMGGLF